MEAAVPQPGSVEEVREKVRATLRRIRAKAKNGTLNEESRMFRLQSKLSQNGDALKHLRFVEEDDEEEAKATGSGVRRITDVD